MRHHRVTYVRWTWVMVAVIGGLSGPAFALDVVLTSQTSKAEVVMTDLPGDASGDLVLVAWRDFGGAEPAGTLIYQRERGRDHTTYRAIGSGPFAIVDAGERTLANGTATPVFEVIVGRDPPLELIATRDASRDPKSLLVAYQAHEHVAGPKERKAAIEAAIKAASARVRTSCGGSLTADIQWNAFDKAGQAALAKETVAVLEAVEALCGDADYKPAVAHLRSIRVGFRGHGALDLSQRGTTIAVTLSPESYNPHEVAGVWLRDHLDAP